MYLGSSLSIFSFLAEYFENVDFPLLETLSMLGKDFNSLCGFKILTNGTDLFLSSLHFVGSIQFDKYKAL